MNFRALILLVIVGTILINGIDGADKKKSSSKKGKKDPCHLKEVEVCLNKVQALGKRKDPTSLIANNEGLNTICKTVREDLSKCVKGYIKKCGTPLHREVTDLVIDQVTTSAERFCDEKNPERAKFLKESPCIHKKVLSQESYKTTCNNNFLLTVDQIEAQNNVDADKTHATICCGYNKWDDCTSKLIAKECGKEAVDSFQLFVGDAFGTVTKMMCPQSLFATKKNICKDVLPKEGTVSKGKLGDNALTKYVVSTFSFLFIVDQ